MFLITLLDPLLDTDNKMLDFISQGIMANNGAMTVEVVGRQRQLLKSSNLVHRKDLSLI